VDAVFELNDSNKDGKLTLEEFQDFMAHKNPASSSSSKPDPQQQQ
jgi:Ca2+-binding EF-hand superfamily protein